MESDNLRFINPPQAKESPLSEAEIERRATWDGYMDDESERVKAIAKQFGDYLLKLAAMTPREFMQWQREYLGHDEKEDGE